MYEWSWSAKASARLNATIRLQVAVAYEMRYRAVRIELLDTAAELMQKPQALLESLPDRKARIPHWQIASIQSGRWQLLTVIGKSKRNRGRTGPVWSAPSRRWQSKWGQRKGGYGPPTDFDILSNADTQKEWVAHKNSLASDQTRNPVQSS